MELDFLDNSDNVGFITVRKVEVSVHQGPVGVTSAISDLGNGTSPNHEYYGPRAAMRHSVNVVPLPLQDANVSASVAVPMLIPGTFLLPGTRAPITMVSGFPAKGQGANVFPQSDGGASAYSERCYAASGRYAVAQSEHALP